MEQLKKFSMSANLQARIITGLVLAPIVLAIVGILVAFAAPSLQNTMRSASIASARDTLAGAIKMARGEAIYRKIPATVCASTDQASCAGGSNWEQGWIIFADEDSDAGTIKGSARSIQGLHIRDALDTVAARNPGLLNKFGGHAMAAGMSLAKNRFAEFQTAFDKVVREQLNNDDLQAKINSDGALAANELSMPMAEMLQSAGPWGQNFPEPSFDGEFYLVNQRIVGDRHLKFTVSHEEGSQQLIDAIAFNVDTDQWPNYRAERLHLSYKLDVNEFRGRRSLQLLVNHIDVL